MKAIQRTLAEITIGMQNKPFQNKIRLPATSEMNAPNPAAWFRPDPDVWQPPNPYNDPDIFGPPQMPIDTRWVKTIVCHGLFVKIRDKSIYIR